MSRNRLLACIGTLALVAGGVFFPSFEVPQAVAWQGGSSAPENTGGVTGEEFLAADGSPLTGKGQMIVIIDGAFNPEHPMLAGRVVEEACFGSLREPHSFNDTTCTRNAVRWKLDPKIHFETGAGASNYNLECVEPDGRICNDTHGTSVAALAAGGAVNVGGVVGTISGIAPEADLALINIGRRGGWNVPAVTAALQYVRDELAPKHTIAAVNISLSFDEIPVADDA